MDTLNNVRTFLLAARLGSFAAAARTLDLAPSVISKRIGQLEHEFGVALFFRSTRELRLTAEATRLLPRFQKLIADFDELRDADVRDAISGQLRVEAPGTVTSSILGPILCAFLERHPAVDLDLRLVDRLGNQVETGSDIVIGIRPSTLEQILDYPLMPYPCAAYAAPSYLAARGEPEHPRDLAGHQALVSLLFGNVWHFFGEDGDVAVTVRPRLSVNDAIVLRQAVRHGLGIALLPRYLAARDVSAGRLTELLPGFRPAPLWLKALVPSRRALRPPVQALIDFLRESLAGAEPADLDGNEPASPPRQR